MRIFTCSKCNKTFSVTYPLSSKRTLLYCSRSCKSLIQGFSVKYSKEELKEKIMVFIKEKNKYCSLEDISKGVCISSKTINKYKISIPKINLESGFFKPKSKFEIDIYSELIKLIRFPIIREKTFKDLLSNKGYPLFIDFYIPELNLVIEADGDQHYDKTNTMYTDYLTLSDNLKNQFCKGKGINMIRIPYTRKVTTKYILKYLKDLSTNYS